MAAPPFLGAIWAQTRSGVIGKAGTMPWHLPEDLANFKSTTTGGAVIMGRGTWDSLPRTPLPGRQNIVLSRQRRMFPGAQVVPDLPAALALTGDLPAWIIGGGQVYAASLPFVTHAVITYLDGDFDGDTFAPALPAHWVITEAGPRRRSATGLNFQIIKYRNLKPQPLPTS